MPHYADGVEAKVGDSVEALGHYNKIRHGVVTAIYPGNTTCNLAVAHINVQRTSGNPDALVVGAALSTVTASEARKLES